MEKLYELCRKYYYTLLEERKNLSYTKQFSLIRKDEEIERILEKIKLGLKSGRYNLNSLILFCKFGDILNMDLLLNFLFNIKYYNLSSNVNELESDNNQFLLEIYNKRDRNILNSINSLMIIDTMIDNLLSFIRREYDDEFFQRIMYVKFYQYNGASSYINKLVVVANQLLSNGYNVGSLNDVIDSFKEKTLDEEELLINLINDSEFIDVLICQLDLFKEALTSIRDKMNCQDKVNGFEKVFYINFINDLLVLIEERIMDLNINKGSKAFIKKLV